MATADGHAHRLGLLDATVRGCTGRRATDALMRTHSGLHVLAGVVFGDFGALVAGGNMEPLTARMDLDLAEVPPDVEDRVAGSVNAELAAAGRSR